MKMLKTAACFILAAMMGYTSIAQTATSKKGKHSQIVKKVEKDAVINVGGSPMDPTKNIVENASKSNDHTTLISAIDEAGLTTTLTEAGPYTVFAPTNEAFEMIGRVGVDSLMLPANKALLSKILTYNVVAGKYSSKDLMDLIAKNNGRAELKTVEGGALIAEKKGDRIMLTDENGTEAFVTIKDVYQSNGIVHVTDRVLMPNTNAVTGKL